MYKKLYYLTLLYLLLGTNFAQTRIDTMITTSVTSAGFNSSAYQAFTYYKQRTYPAQGVDKLNFRLLPPLNYNPAENKTYPLFVMYHGKGEAGTGSTPINDYQLKWGGKLHLDARNGVLSYTVNGVSTLLPRVDAFVYFPQEPYGSWTNNYKYSDIPVGQPGSQMTTAMSMSWDVIDSLKLLYKIDPDRIYVHGLSSGGTAVWTSLYHRPDLFAAAQPMSTPGDTARAKYVANIPIWLHQGQIDDNPLPYYSHLMIAALKAAGAVDTLLRYSEYPPPTKHDTWLQAYANPDFFPFFLRQNKKHIRFLGVNPVCPGESVALGFSYNYYYYQWYKDGVAIAGANNFRLENITEGGLYHVKYKRKSTSILENSDTVTVTASLGAPKPTITPSGSILLPSPDATNVILRAPKGFTLYEWSNGSTKDSVIVATNGTYTVRVRQEGQCWSLISDPITVKTDGNSAGSPATPTNLVAVPRSSTSILFTWTDNSSNETGFEVYRSTLPQGPFKFIKLTASNSTSYIDTLLNPNTRYYYKVRSINEFGGNLSTSFAYTNTYKDFELPSTPTELKILNLDVNNGITLTWKAATDNNAIKEYRIYSNGILLGVSTTNSIRITPPAGVTYLFQVVAVDISNNASLPSATLQFKYDGFGLICKYYEVQALNKLPNFSQLTPIRYGVVSNFNITNISTSNPSLTDLITNTDIISGNENFQLNIEGYIKIPSAGTYVFYLKSDDGSKMYLNNQQVIDNDGLHGDIELSYTATYTSSTWVPIKVEFFEKTGGQTLNVSWAKTSGGSNFAKQSISNAIGGSQNLSYLPSGYIGNIANIQPGQPQGITLVSIPASSSSSSSGTISNLTGIDKPKIKLTWNSTNISNVTSYEIYRIKTSITISSLTSTNINWVKIANIPYDASRTYIDSVGTSTTPVPGYLQHGNYYYYMIIPVSLSGVGTSAGISSSLYLSNSFNSIASLSSYTPTNMSLTAISNNIVRVTWTDNNKANNTPSSTGASESGTQIWRSSYKNGPYYLVGNANRNATTFFDSSGILNNKYYYKIRAYNYKGYTNYTNIDSTTTLSKPNPPVNLAATAIGPNNINLSWIVTDDIAYGFSIYRSTNNVNFTKIDSIPNPGLSFYQDKNLSANTTYFYKIRAYNNYLSDFSTTVNATTVTSFTPSSLDWRMPIVAGTISHNFETNLYSNLGKIQKLKDSLELKRDFLDFMYLGNTATTKYLQFKLPAASEFPNGGIITYNVAETIDNGADTTRMAVGNNGSLPYPNNNIEKGYFTLIVEVSNTADFSVKDSYSVFRGARNNQLQKIDLPVTWANKYVRINISITPTSSSKTMWLSEIGLYRFLGAGVRHNYFVLTGASVEEQFMPMGLRRFRKMISKIPAMASLGKNMLIFNLAISGSNSLQLRDSMQYFLSRHPNAGFVLVHQGGNNINSAFNNMRPLTFERLQTNPNAKNLIKSFEDIIKTIYSNGKIPYISRMHFRDYRSGGSCGPNDIPAVFGGRNQENGSLPINLLLDSLTKIYTPYAWSETEKRSLVNFYPISLNQQDLIQGDGIHPSEAGIVGQANFDTLTNYWLQYTIRHAYLGTYNTPKIYNPGSQISNFSICGNAPSNKPKLDSLTAAAVELALSTKSGKDIWDARILVEQMGDKYTRVPYVLKLDSLRDFRSPNNPSDLTVSSIDNTSTILNWLDLSFNETAFEIYRSTNGGVFTKIASVAANSINYTDNGLSAVNEYTYYVRAINGTFESGNTNKVKIRPTVIYYLKSSGDLTVLNSWGRNSNGSGSNPSNFAGAGQTFVIANRSSMTNLNADLNISGQYSKMVVLEGQSLKISPNVTFTGNITLKNNSNLYLYGLNLPTFEDIDTTSSIFLGSNLNLPNSKTWGNISVEKNIATVLPAQITVKGSIALKSGSSFTGSSTNLSLKGNLIFEDSLLTTGQFGLNCMGKKQSIDAKTGTLNLSYLKLTNNDTVSVLNGSKIKINGTGTDCDLANSSLLSLGNGKLYISGNTSLNKTNNTGAINTNGGGIYINVTSSDNHNLWLSEKPYENQLNDLHLSSPSINDSLHLRTPLIIKNNLKLSAGVLKSNNMIALTKDDQNTSRILKVGANAKILDSVLYQYYIGPNKKQGTHYVGSAIHGRKLYEWKYALNTLRFTSSGSDVRTFNESLNKWDYVLDTTTITTPGKGFTVFLPDSVFQNSTTGSVTYYNYGLPVIGNGSGNNTTNFNIPITKTADTKGWNLVANPYPCEVDWNKAAGWDKSQVQSSIYMYDGNNRRYAVYDANTKTRINGGDSIIPSGQAFFVRKNDIGTGNLGINEDAKVSFTPEFKFFKLAETDVNYSKLFINITDGVANSDETALVFGSNLSSEIDENDVEKNEGSIMNLYSVVNGKKYAIQSLTEGYSSAIPLGFNSTQTSSSHYLIFSDEELFYKLSKLTLTDNFLNTTTDVLKKPYYKFDYSTATGATGNGRFVLNYEFADEIITTVNDPSEIQNLALYPNPFNHQLFLGFNSHTTSTAEVSITDITGRRVYHNHINFSKGYNKVTISDFVDFEKYGKGVYILNIKSGNSNYTNKIIFE